VTARELLPGVRFIRSLQGAAVLSSESPKNRLAETQYE